MLISPEPERYEHDETTPVTIVSRHSRKLLTVIIIVVALIGGGLLFVFATETGKNLINKFNPREYQTSTSSPLTATSTNPFSKLRLIGSDYYRDEHNVYYIPSNIFGYNIDGIKTLEGFNLNDFDLVNVLADDFSVAGEDFDDAYGLSLTDVYFRGMVLPNIDRKTFKLSYDRSFFKDKDYVYHRHFIGSDKDVKSIAYEKGIQSEDDWRKFLNSSYHPKIEVTAGGTFMTISQVNFESTAIELQRLEGVDPESFTLMSQTWAGRYFKDKNSVYFLFETKEPSNLYTYTLGKIPKISSEAFTILQSDETETYAANVDGYYKITCNTNNTSCTYVDISKSEVQQKGLIKKYNAFLSVFKSTSADKDCFFTTDSENFRCYTDLAISTIDKKWCEKVSNKSTSLSSVDMANRNSVYSCYLDVANALHNESICGNIPEGDGYFDLKTECVTLVAVFKHNKSLCDVLTKDTDSGYLNKYKCYQFVEPTDKYQQVVAWFTSKEEVCLSEQSDCFRGVEGKVPLTIHFIDDSLGEITSWQWDFNTDGIIDSTEQNPTYTYTKLDESTTVILKVEGPMGKDERVGVTYVDLKK